MKKVIVIALSMLIIFSQTSFAKIWRVNNNTAVNANYTNIQAAIDAVTTLNGDTIHVEASAAGYGNCYLSKKLFIIGPGYFLTETSPLVANVKTQVNPNIAYLNFMQMQVGSKGSVVSGMYINSYCVIQDTAVTVQHCYINGSVYFGDNYTITGAINDTIRQNYITGGFTCGYNTTGKFKNILVYNNIIGGQTGADFSANINNVDGFFINNSFVYFYSSGSNNPVFFSTANIVYQNNIFGFVNFGAYQSSNVYFNNICNGSGVPAGNSNVQNVDASAVVYNDWIGNGAGFSSDGRYQLKPTSNPALNAGTINGTTINCGAFGGPAPYILSGMSNVPSIYALTVPTQINTGTTTMNITLSSASH